MNKAELVFKQQREKHEQARAYAEQEVLKQEDDGHGNNEVYNKAYDYFLSEIYQEPEQQEEDFFKAILETAKENGHQEPTPEETEQAQTQSDLNLSKYCEGLKNE